jgi:ABC-type branched-subunit amino acid transport system substrate-binding protein
MRVRRTERRRPRSIAFLAGATTLALALSACGSSSKPAADSSTTTTGGGAVTGTTAPQTTDLGTGVTADKVKVGIVLINYDNDIIKANIDFKRGDQQEIFQAFIDDINKNGGVGGLQIDPVYDIYDPLGPGPAQEACTKLTEDDKVFATIGVLIDDSGAAQVCFAKQHKSILITHELSKAIMDKVPGGLMLTTDTLAERTDTTLIDDALKAGLITDKKFGILADTSTKTRIDDAIKPALKKNNLAVGTAGVMTVDPSGDTTQSLAQLDSFIERWKGENVNALFITGLTAVSKVYVQRIRKAFPDITILADGDASAKGAAQDLKNAGITPNPYDGVLAEVPLTDAQQWETPSLQECVKIYEDASGAKVASPMTATKDAEGKTDQIWITVRDACSDMKFFKLIADKIGKYLNNENWIQAVDNFGPIDIVAQPKSSLGKGKYDASDSASLSKYDSTAGAQGDWATVNATG